GAADASAAAADHAEVHRLRGAERAAEDRVAHGCVGARVRGERGIGDRRTLQDSADRRRIARHRLRGRHGPADDSSERRLTVRVSVTTRFTRVVCVAAIAVAAASCAAGRAFRKGDAAARAGNLDQAVAYYRAAVQAAPENPDYKIALQRTMTAAGRVHQDRAKASEAQARREAAPSESRLAPEYDPSNRSPAGKAPTIERPLRERGEPARPKPPIQQMRERARAATVEPILNPSARDVRFH